MARVVYRRDGRARQATRAHGTRSISSSRRPSRATISNSTGSRNTTSCPTTSSNTAPATMPSSTARATIPSTAFCRRLDVEHLCHRLVARPNQLGQMGRRQCDLILGHTPSRWFGESGPIRRAVEPYLVRRMNERGAYCRIEWLPSVSDKTTPAVRSKLWRAWARSSSRHRRDGRPSCWAS